MPDQPDATGTSQRPTTAFGVPLTRLTMLNLLAQVGIVVTGGAVRLTGSGLGCPTFPSCTEDDFFPTPELAINGVIEFANRTLTGVVGLIAILTLYAVWRCARRDLFPTAIGVLLGILAQAGLGGVTVLTGLNPWTVALHFLVSMVLATLIHPLPQRLRTFFRAAYYLPAVTSAVFIALVWKWILNANPWGLANHVLSLFGAGPVSFISDPSPFLGANVALWSIILSSVLTIPAVGVVLYSAALAGIPRDLYEAAETEGAGALAKFRYITVPLLKPITLYVTIIYTIAAFEVFERVYVMTGGGPGYATHTIVYLIWRTGFRFGDYGVASAQAFLLFIVIATISVLQFRALRSDVEY